MNGPALHGLPDEVQALLRGAAVFAPGTVPLTWVLEAARLTVAPFTVLAQVDLTLGTVSLQPEVREAVRAEAEAESGESWRELCRRAVKAATLWLWKMMSDSAPADAGELVEAKLTHLNAALLVAEGLSEDALWIDLADPLAWHEIDRGRAGTGLLLFRGSLARERQLHPDEPDRIARSLMNVGEALWDLKDWGGAKDMFADALALLKQCRGQSHPDLLEPLDNLARALFELDRLEAARSVAERHLDLEETTHGSGTKEAFRTLKLLAMISWYQQDLPACRRYYERCHALGEALNGENHADVIHALTQLGRVLMELGHLSKARPLLSAVAILDRTPDAESSQLGSALGCLGAILWRQGDLEAARSILQRGLDHDRAFSLPQRTVLIDLLNLAGVLEGLGQRAESRSLLEEALQIAEAQEPVDTDRVRDIRARLARLRPTLQ